MQKAQAMMSKAKDLVELLKAKGFTLATAESCTGGWIAQAITSVPGSSEVFDCGWVTYSNAAKQRCLGVSEQTLTAHGAVSVQTAVAMAKGALDNSNATISVATTGIAGPGGGTLEKPIGTVIFAWAQRDNTPDVELKVFSGDREAIRAQAVLHALDRLINS
jgi:nicotinamide-nucleotide amidase